MVDGPIADGRWLRIKALFANAIEQPPEGLAAWIDAHCGGDAELRRELESLLASYHSATDFMEQPAIAGPGAAEAVANRVVPRIQAAMTDRRLGPYRLVGELGRGGMGVVYLAERDDQAFDRQVAIKMVHGGVLHPSLVERFEAERRILARLEHPNIARLLDAGTDENGTPFAVMEYIEGTPIDVYVRDRRLSIAQRLELFCAVCDAVQYSHERLVVHRDIKPGNLLVDKHGVPKLLDFGIAKLLGGSGAVADRTRSDLRALTPESASPEQVRGDPITVASDVYSLGVLLFRLLTDRSPYRSDVRGDLDMARAICEEEPLRPSDVVADGNRDLSSRELAARRRELKGDLDRIAIKALEKEPMRRYASVDRFALDIRRHLRGEPVEAGPDSRRYRAGKFLRRHRAGVSLTVAISATMTAGLIATMLQVRVARIERERAERRFDEVRGLAHSMIFEVHDAIAQLPGSTTTRELLIRRSLRYMDRLASEAGTDLSLQRELASAYIRIGNVQGHGGTANLGQQAAAIESYRKALAIRERVANAVPSDRAVQSELATVQLHLGALLWQVGDFRDSLAHMNAAVAINERLLVGQASDLSAQAGLGWCYLALTDLVLEWDDRERALSLLQKALPLFERTAAAAPSQMPLRHALAGTYKRTGRIEAMQEHHGRALEAYRKALAIDQATLAAEPDLPIARMDVGVDLREIAAILLVVGDPKEALSACERAQAIGEDLVRADPNDTRVRVYLAESISRVALVRWRLGDRERALAARRSALVHLDTLAAIQPADVSVQALRPRELAELGLGYAQLDSGRSRVAACRRARPFLMRGLDAYRDLAAKRPLPAEATEWFSKLQAAAAQCGLPR